VLSVRLSTRWTAGRLVSVLTERESRATHSRGCSQRRPGPVKTSKYGAAVGLSDLGGNLEYWWLGPFDLSPHLRRIPRTPWMIMRLCLPMLVDTTTPPAHHRGRGCIYRLHYFARHFPQLFGRRPIVEAFGAAVAVFAPPSFGGWGTSHPHTWQVYFSPCSMYCFYKIITSRYLDVRGRSITTWRVTGVYDHGVCIRRDRHLAAQCADETRGCLSPLRHSSRGGPAWPIACPNPGSAC
jgi:hypothetical protein